MSDPSWKPGLLALPECWQSGDSIGPIIIDYEGPSLVAAEIIFTVGTQTFTNPTDISVAPYAGTPPAGKNYTETITIKMFDPADAGQAAYKAVVNYAPGGPLNRRTLKKGVWSLDL